MLTKQEELTALRVSLTANELKIKSLEQELAEDAIKTTIEKMPNGFMMGIKRKDKDQRDMVFYTNDEFENLFSLMVQNYSDDYILFGIT